MLIATERLRIRPFKSDDWKAVWAYTSNPAVMTYIPGGVQSRDDAQQFVNDNLGNQAQHYAVLLKDSHQLIGHLVFHKYFGEHTYEIGWVFSPHYRNQGYATEAARSMLKYGFEELRLHRIIATCQPENTPSYRVMEKIGMRREGFFKKCIPNGAHDWWDEYYYAILQEEWLALTC
ncbi:GNAT family N-acetyltransferase [Paenibacillus sp. FSL H8-0537]|uniref:GNAT family N-acetyltransferase n=1 Tax=Paenibacillus sp. FSL H8-0537 TaxID=2921399 RepID=UPI0031011AA2